MNRPLFHTNVIALVWDFDRTLIPGHMQEPLFRHYGIDGASFFREANRLAGLYRREGVLASDVQYLNHLLTYSREGKLPGFSNRLLRELGAKLEFFPGAIDFLGRVRRQVSENSTYESHEIHVEHYIVSTGLRQMILGSAAAEHVEHVWGCEFVERVPRSGFDGKHDADVLTDDVLTLAYEIDDTSKTRALFEINKGTCKEPRLHVNDLIPEAERRIPFSNIIYIADGPSDVPVFSLVGKEGGRTFGVYEERNPVLFADVDRLREQGRIQAHAPANYEAGSPADMWLTRAVESIADRIVAEHASRVASVARPAGHRIDEPKESKLAPNFGIPPKARRDLAEDLLRGLGVTAPPVPLEAILRELNIEVTTRRSQREEAILTAMSPPGDDSVPTAWLITLSSTQRGVRMRYTLAHEIGHVVLHARDGLTRARANATTSAPQEREAQAFASELLMPDFLLEPAVREHGPDPAVLAKLFAVSKKAMEIRLQDSGYLRRLGEL